MKPSRARRIAEAGGSGLECSWLVHAGAAAVCHCWQKGRRASRRELEGTDLQRPQHVPQPALAPRLQHAVQSPRGHVPADGAEGEEEEEQADPPARNLGDGRPHVARHCRCKLAARCGTPPYFARRALPLNPPSTWPRRRALPGSCPSLPAPLQPCLTAALLCPTPSSCRPAEGQGELKGLPGYHMCGTKERRRGGSLITLRDQQSQQAGCSLWKASLVGGEVGHAAPLAVSA